jgi:hypothetical protein
VPVLTRDDMTVEKAREVLGAYVSQVSEVSDSERRLAAAVVLAEAARLRQLLRDLVDFDAGVPPELDQLDAEYGPRQLARMERAWEAAITEVGPRDQSRFEQGDPS